MAGEQSSKLTWMYEGKNSSIDHEQYLLGKRITSISKDDEEKGDFLVKPESSVATGNVTVLERLDYESKVREDPLFKIRKNDYDHRKELLSNPLKKKRIQNMLKEALERDLRRSGARQEQSDSSSDETDESSSSSSSSENERRRDKHRRKKQDKVKQGKHHKESRAEERTERRYSSKSSEKHKDHEEPIDRHKSEGFGLICVQDGKHVSKIAKKRRIRTPSPEKPKERYQRVNRSGFSKRLTKEELEKKRNEMMNNASLRDSQRKNNVKKFKMEDEREEEKERKQRLDREKDKYGHSKDFLHKMKLKTASSGSVADSVRRKKHTLNHKF